MKKLWSFIFVAVFFAFAWLSLPRPGDLQKTASGIGTVLAIDREKGVVTISHGALPALNMMAMTMSFPVKDKGQLVNLQPMQKVEFQLTYDGNDYLITEIK